MVASLHDYRFGREGFRDNYFGVSNGQKNARGILTPPCDSGTRGGGAPLACLTTPRLDRTRFVRCNQCRDTSLASR